MIRVGVLGSTGMLGSMVSRWLERRPDLTVVALARPAFEAEQIAFGSIAAPLDSLDYVINCIGVIKPYCKDDDAKGVRRAIVVNALFPHALAAVTASTGTRVIQIATDCVYSGSRGSYAEDDEHDALDAYGKTKSLGEVHCENVLHVRCSIVGPELGRVSSLLEWFLSQPKGSTVRGFAHHLWNGVTTLQFAQLTERIITTTGAFESARREASIHHFAPNEVVSKYELLSLFAEHLHHDVTVLRVSDSGPALDRTLRTTLTSLESIFPRSSMGAALADLNSFLPAYHTGE